MKSIFYSLAIVAIAAAGFFGWTAKDNYEAKIKERDGLILDNRNLSDNIDRETTNRETALRLRTLL